MDPVAKQRALQTLTFGSQVAEEERDILKQYFVRTQAWERIYTGVVDVVYGSKGAGKSAIYVLINDSADDLFDRGVLLVAAENPQGSPAFANLVRDPPASEREFISIWKLYFVALIARALEDYGISNSESKELREILEEAGLLASKKTVLAIILNTVHGYVRRFLNPGSIENSVTIDPNTGAPTFAQKITFEEPDIAAHKRGVVSVDSLLDLASRSLDSAGYKIWLMVDRLDVAFDESSDLEKNALRALFKAYRDLRIYSGIEVKIFLRTDIWKRITESGFREATHISREIHLNWDKLAIENLIIRRILNNKLILDLFGVDKSEVLASSERQSRLFGRMFPDQVEVGEKQSTTIDWLLKRTADGTKLTQPRDIILFLNRLCEIQNSRHELGHAPPSEELLFDRTAFKEALPALSEYRVTRVLFSEYPNLRTFIDALREQKTEQNVQSLARLWSVDIDAAQQIAKQLRDVGFFEERPSKTEPSYWIPFVYRPYLSLSQGKVDELQAAEKAHGHVPEVGLFDPE